MPFSKHRNPSHEVDPVAIQRAGGSGNPAFEEIIPQLFHRTVHPLVGGVLTGAQGRPDLCQIPSMERSNDDGIGAASDGRGRSTVRLGV